MALLVASSMIGNLGWTVYNVHAIGLRQAVTPGAALGRMNATAHFVTAGMTPLGGLVGGLLGQMFGLRGAIAVGAAGSAFAFLWVLLSPIRRTQQMPSVGAEAAAASNAGGVPGLLRRRGVRADPGAERQAWQRPDRAVGPGMDR